MATYKQITQWVEETYKVRIHNPCFIAHAKELSGLPVFPAWNRKGTKRKKPCPPEMLPKIQAAFRHFHML